MKPLVNAAWALFTLLIVLYLLLPLLLVVLFSFNASALTSLPLTGITLDWYVALFAMGSFWSALQNSLVIAFAVAVLSVAIGTLAALSEGTQLDFIAADMIGPDLRLRARVRGHANL